jgi:translation initiation factor 4G
LNKLSEENFDSISNKLINIGVISVEALKMVIKLIFEKALLEPKFCKMYAELCRKMSENTPDFQVEGKTQVTWVSIFLIELSDIQTVAIK